MCGIVGILGTRDAAPLILEALKRLEYRGYDSAGIATIHDKTLTRRRASGKLNKLESIINKTPLQGTVGIGHTRWATHGLPNEQNAHPHGTEKIAVVHNGIIENFRALKKMLENKGIKFETETDTEVIVHLYTDYLAQTKDPLEAARATFNCLEGAFAIGLILANDENRIIVARKGSPLAIGHGEGEMFIGSDAFSLAPLTNKITYLEDGDWASISRDKVAIYTADGEPVQRTQQSVDASIALIDKGGHKHFMAKEIFEQPEVISHTFTHYVDSINETICLPRLPFALGDISRISFIACGTAYYAAMVAKTWVEKLAQIPADFDIASEFRYRTALADKTSLAVFISQSGETADTLAALKHCKENNIKTLAIVNVPESSMTRMADITLPIFAGPEIGVASTKAFTCQLAVLLSLAVAIGKARGLIDKDKEREIVHNMLTAPRIATEILKLNEQIEEVAIQHLAQAKNAIYIGRQTMYALALEGALKLKEISYIHAEGFASGELKHGSIALIDEYVPVITLAPSDTLFEKTISNMQEVMARKGTALLITDKQGADKGSEGTAAHLCLPDMAPLLTPLFYAIPLQLLAYHTAVAKGTDVDQPRNLAKSVTVE
ncbi:MAG: glutamine--fructose-6-phosphate transaminase (isomerizing) [Alphaproteobacteria bacterium]|nr:glutamine--fructose-6-phosphate transaminase (isomerizing) [Alphaproteobacteria bacterium]